MKKKTSDILLKIAKLDDKNCDKISIGDIVNKNPESKYFILFMLSILSIIPTPFPIPIVSILFGLFLIYLSIQLVIGKIVIKLPNFINNYGLKKDLVIKIVKKFIPITQKIENMTKNRLYFFKNRTVRIMLNIFILILSILVVIPIPLTSVFPAIAIILITFGIMNNDGLFVLLGIISSILTFGLFTLIFIFGKVFITKLMLFLKWKR